MKEPEVRTMEHGGKRPGAGRKKSEVVRKVRTYSATDEEHKQIEHNAKAAGVSTSEYIRRRCMGAPHD